MKIIFIIFIIILDIKLNASSFKEDLLLKELSFFKSRSSKINYINTYINSFYYKSDLDNYNIKDYWATPKEFFKKRGGDCEDFVISKIYYLKKIGILNDNIFVYYTLYNNKNHLGLVLKDNKKYIYMDNNINKPILFSNIAKYNISDKGKLIPYLKVKKIRLKK
jgi:predicted transglutaminase-like cysteine proteinase